MVFRDEGKKMSTHTDLGHKALKGSVFIGGAQAMKIVLQFVSVVVLARLLMPEDFGLVAAVSPLIIFLGLFQDFGLQQAVVQRKDISHTQMNGMFWLTIAIGAVRAVVMVSISTLVAWFYDEPRMQMITIAVTVSMMLNAILSLPLGLLNREMRFGLIAALEVTASVSGLLVAIWAALNGFGYWALVMSPAMSALVVLIGSWVGSGWKPGLPSVRVDRDILSFGMNLTGAKFVNFFSRNLDNVLIGRFVGAEGLGFYDRAYKLMLFPLENVGWPLSRIMTPVLSRLQDDPERFRRVYMRSVGALTLVSVPGVAALVITAEETIGLLFGERWLGVVPIFAWLGLAAMVQPLTTSSGWVFISLAKTDVMFRWGIFAALTTIAAFVGGLWWDGVVGLAMAYALSEVFIRMPALFAVMARTTPIKFFDLMLIQGPLLAAAGLTWALVGVIEARLALHDIGLIVIAILVSYALALCAFLLHGTGRRILREILDSVLKFIGRG